MTNPEWVPKAEAAARLGVSMKTLERHINAGRIETRRELREGRRPATLCRVGDLEALLPAGFLMPAASAIAPADARSPVDVATVATIVAMLLGKRELLQDGAAAAAVGLDERRPVCRFLTIRQAALSCGLSVAWLRRAIADGSLPHVRDGRSIKVRREDLARL